MTGCFVGQVCQHRPTGLQHVIAGDAGQIAEKTIARPIKPRVGGFPEPESRFAGQNLDDGRFAGMKTAFGDGPYQCGLMLDLQSLQVA